MGEAAFSSPKPWDPQRRDPREGAQPGPAPQPPVTVRGQRDMENVTVKYTKNKKPEWREKENGGS